MIDKLIEKYPIIKQMRKEKEVYWINPNCDNTISQDITLGEIKDADARLRRFAPYIKKAFYETSSANGIIESPLKDIPLMKEFLEDKTSSKLNGRLMLKCDNNLPISGSIKARGGIYEVLWFAEKVAMENGMININDDYSKLALCEFKDLFSKYTIVVGSTGNLGLSIGIMGARLGFRVIVHMSIDASKWKKDLLSQKGAEVVEHSGDYGEAVAVGRKQAEQDANSYFVDDENSRTLFLGYAVTGLRMKEQLDKQDITVDKDHPLFVYLPCGVGSAPGGVAFGLKQMYGENVRCFFSEPVKAPCMFLSIMTGLHEKICVKDIGLDGKTIADGLAVSRASGLVSSLTDNLIEGFFTVHDGEMKKLVGELYNKEGIFVEPSAAAGFPGFSTFQFDKNYAEKFSQNEMENSTHIVWATGGGMVPKDVRAKYI